MDEDQYRCERIDMEVIVDCYGDEEISYGWEAYMDDALVFPFKARIINNASCEIPDGELVIVTDMLGSFDIVGSVLWLKDHADTIEDVEVQWNDKEFYVDVEDLEPFDKDIQTLEAIKDWNYWLKKY
ncbi:MAG: calcium-binding protein [Methanobrevibacter sp.]|jgi:hypothetical protein|nr:calcium-binding protein [Methanobrevibacter sp.]